MAVENMTGRVETNYSINRSTVYITGIIQTPVAGAKGTPAKFIRTHAPVEVEIINWVAKSEKGPPTIPDPYDSGIVGLNANRILLNSSIGMVVQVPIGGGTLGHIFSVSGTYTYGAVTAGPIVRDYLLGKYPFDADITKETNYIPATSFSKDILDQRENTVNLLNPLGPVAEPGKFP